MTTSLISKPGMCELTFPCLLESEHLGIIILATDEDRSVSTISGMVVFSNNLTHPIGVYYDNWGKKDFRLLIPDFKITLKNG